MVLLLPGLDSLAQPTQAQALELYGRGYRWWAFNVWGLLTQGGSASGLWAPSTAKMIASIGFRLLPIGVPPLNLSGDPAAHARVALAAAETYGITGLIACDTERSEASLAGRVAYLDAWHAQVTAEGAADAIYKGAQYVPAGAATWNPSWVTSPPTTLPARSAQQWAGNQNVAGINVDLNVATPDFPLWPLSPTPSPAPIPEPDMTVAATARSPLGPAAYYALTPQGSVYSYNGAIYYGAVDGAGNHPKMIPGDTAQSIVVSDSGHGYLITTAEGHGYSFGDFPAFTGPVPT